MDWGSLYSKFLQRIDRGFGLVSRFTVKLGETQKPGYSSVLRESHRHRVKRRGVSDRDVNWCQFVFGHFWT